MTDVHTKRPKSETRTTEQLRQQYELEKELASRLRNASREERQGLYSSLYDELFKRVPHHPQLTLKAAPEQRHEAVLSRLQLLRHFINENTVFMEIGPGDCALSFEVARFVKRVYAVDVSKEITKTSTKPDNFQLVISDGCSIPVPTGSVDVAYSDQLMEHLHPDDALVQLQNIFTALTSTGIYLCITPNRLDGPHDISMYFDDQATGFHLHEYTITELRDLFFRVGFSKVKVYVWKLGFFLMLPLFPFRLLEQMLCALPRPLSKQLSRTRILSWLLYIRMVAIK